MGHFRIILFLSLVISHLSLAEVRYVSHTGTNTPPYLSWETAADSIMSAVNISSFGDTIYVANGVYEEQVVMIPGLSLIGAGMDSCVINFQTIVIPAVTVEDSCLLKGFKIIVSSTLGSIGIESLGNSGLILYNKVIDASQGIYVNESDATVYNNIFVDIKTYGIDIFNSNSIIRGNTIGTDPNSTSGSVGAINIGAYFFTYTPVIDSNYMLLNGAGAVGINKAYGARPIITNNILILNPGSGMAFSHSDSVKVFNNLIYGRGYGISNYAVETMIAKNNYIGGEIGTGIRLAQGGDIVENNIITDAEIGIDKHYASSTPTVKYNNLWHNTSNYSGFTGDTTNLSVDPMVVNDDTSKGELDYHLQMFSPLINRGDPAILDKDSTRSDIGLYGGPFGESYTYQDLAPRPPVNLTGTLSADTTTIELSWNKNTEADFSHYNIFRDTTENFTADSTTFIVSVEDTFYLSIIPQNTTNLYYKLTAADNQGNESMPSEELHVSLTGIIKNEQFVINNYKLFQNYPNPFNPSTRIGYRLKEAGYVKLYVYDIKGELVEVLVNHYQGRGYYEVEFEGEVKSQKSEVKSRFASGIYIYQIMVRNGNNIPVFSDMNKMILLK